MDQHTMRNVQEAMQKEANIFQSFQEPLQKLAVSKGQYEAQINENEAVLKELELVNEEDGLVWKLHGPVLIKQDLAEAKLNVNKRLEFMRNAIADVETKIEKVQQDMMKSKKKLQQIQELFQNAQKEMSHRAMQQQQSQS